VQIDSGCQPYNAKWDATVFATAGACTLFQNNSGLSVTFAGRLSWECAAQVLTLGAGGEVLFSGPLVGNSQNPTAGTFLACEAAILNTDNSTTALGARRSYSQQMASGTNTLTSAFPGQLREVHVEFKASNYHFEYYGIVAPIAGASGGWKESFFIDNANGAGFGTPGFSVNSNGYLIMSNTGWPTTGTNLVTAIYAEKANAVGGAGGKQQKI
jgi:hypothetical protein